MNVIVSFFMLLSPRFFVSFKNKFIVIIFGDVLKGFSDADDVTVTSSFKCLYKILMIR